MAGHIPGPRRLAEGNLELVNPAGREESDSEIVVTRVHDTIDPFLAFDSEDGRNPAGSTATTTTESVVATKSASGAAVAASRRGAVAPAAAAQPRRPRWRAVLLGLGALVIAVAAAGLTYVYLQSTRTTSVTASPPASGAVPPSLPPAPGSVYVSSQPLGVQVLIDGEVRGVTPLRLSLAAGSHVIEIEHQGARRATPVAVEAGATSSHYYDLTAAAPATGRLEVTSDPTGATVVVDGVARGVTPLAIASIPPGPHRVVLSYQAMTATRSVTVNAGATATLAVPLPRPTARIGSVSLQSSIELDIFLDGTKVGSTGTSVSLPAGTHSLDLLNAALEFRTSLTVDVPAGGTATAVVTIPRGKLSINATPWADVSLDGKPVGQTPIANLDVSIGTHEVIWRHPQLGERRQTVVVKAQTPARIGIDLNR